MKKTWVGNVMIVILAASAHAGETRIWMSRQGGIVEAQLGSVRGDSVSLINKDSKELRLKIEDLSLADRQHLVEVGGASEEIITGGKPGLVEKDVRVASSTFKSLEGALSFPECGSDSFKLFESTHFLVGFVGDVRPNAIAETAERMWHGMAFQHMNFRKDWGDKRMLILLVADSGVHTSLGAWVSLYHAAAGRQEAAQQSSATWSKSGSSSIPLPDEMMEQYKLSETALVFNVNDAGKFRKDLSPFPVHVIAGRLLDKQMGGVSSFGSEGYFAISTGHAYFKEISLAGKSETNLLSVEGSTKNDISSKGGFEDGTSWARTLRSMVRSGKVSVQFEQMLKWKPEELTPERLVLIYSFAYYMESDSKRLAAFSKMIRRVESSKQIPAPEEIATIFGFENVAAFNEDWVKFIKEGDFK